MSHTREDIEFTVNQSLCRAWLYRPAGRGSVPGPGIVMAHGLGGTRDAGLEPFATKLADNGFFVLVFDYRHFGASDGEPRQLCSVDKQLRDWTAAIRCIREVPGVDPGRIGLWGFSLSGGHAFVMAARDGRIGAISVLSPVLDTFAAAASFQRVVGLGNVLKSLVAGGVDLLKGLLGLPPVYIPIYGSPDELAPISDPEDALHYAALAPEHGRNQICARYSLLFKGYRAIAHASKIRCPCLLQVAMRDRVIPFTVAQKAAHRIGANATLEQYDCGHMHILVAPYLEQVTEKQLEFFRHALVPANQKPDP